MGKLCIRDVVVYNACDHLVEFKVGVSIFAVFLVQDVHSGVIVDPRNNHVVNRDLLVLFNVLLVHGGDFGDERTIRARGSQKALQLLEHPARLARRRPVFFENIGANLQTNK